MTAWWVGAASWSARVVAAGILVQTLYFKFTYAPETATIFDARGGRPAAALVGVLELVAAVLLLVPRTTAVGAALALALMGGALATHLTSLGIEVRNPTTGEGDGGLLFALAVVVAGCAGFVLAVHRRELPLVARFLPAI